MVLPGPGKDLERIRTPATTIDQRVPPSIESQLMERQKQMIALLIQGEELTSRKCEERFGITRPTAASDFRMLMELGLVEKKGEGRSTRYVMATRRIVK